MLFDLIHFIANLGGFEECFCSCERVSEKAYTPTIPVVCRRLIGKLPSKVIVFVFESVVSSIHFLPMIYNSLCFSCLYLSPECI